MMVYQESFVQRNGNRIYVRDHPGAEPTIILMHGFPENLHLYDRLLPYLSPRVESLPLIFLAGVLRINPLAIPIIRRARNCLAEFLPVCGSRNKGMRFSVQSWARTLIHIRTRSSENSRIPQNQTTSRVRRCPNPADNSQTFL